jgi:acyl-CoA synthetase (AMP-forming)/AMP-acid ligase II
MRNGLFYDALPPNRRPSDPTLLATPIGMTETNGPYTAIDRHLPEHQRGSLGKLMPGVQVRLVEPDTGAILGEWLDETLHADSREQVGILLLRSDVMMLGMVKRERSDVFTPDGWYASGDLVSFRDGHLHCHGRADDLIKANGANVSPREVESVILKMSGVTAAHAAGVSDSVRGSVVGVVVVIEPGHELTSDAIRAECARVLASYKVPRVIVTCSAADLPVLPSSKVDRRGLVRMLEAHAAEM